MKVFYSWQSDTDQKINRYFIQDALLKIAKDFAKENILNIEIDQATRDEPGSPNIPATIFKKIDECVIFVADISFINEFDAKRRTPNPNVLIELGYAIKNHGYEKTILIFNNKFGKPEELPFDIRQHRILQYNYDGNKRDVAMDVLIKDLKIAIMTIDKKTANANKIKIVFFNDGKEYGEEIVVTKTKYLPISKKTFLDTVETDKIRQIKKDERTFWQEYLFRAIKNNIERKEVLNRLPPGQAYVEHRFLGDLPNLNYFEEYLTTALNRENTLALNFMLKNSNEKAFEKIKIIFSMDKEVPITRHCDFPEYPSESRLAALTYPLSIKEKTLFLYNHDNTKKYFECDIDLLHIGESCVLQECLFLQLIQKKKFITINYIIYFMDMPQIEGMLTINTNINEEVVTPCFLFEL
jgi:hypothetical protein